MVVAVCADEPDGIERVAWEAVVGLLVGKDCVGWDARALNDRLSANLPGNAFKQIAFRPVYGHVGLLG